MWTQWIVGILACLRMHRCILEKSWNSQKQRTRKGCEIPSVCNIGTVLVGVLWLGILKSILPSHWETALVYAVPISKVETLERGASGHLLVEGRGNDVSNKHRAHTKQSWARLLSNSPSEQQCKGRVAPCSGGGESCSGNEATGSLDKKGERGWEQSDLCWAVESWASLH